MLEEFVIKDCRYNPNLNISFSSQTLNQFKKGGHLNRSWNFEMTQLDSEIDASSLCETYCHISKEFVRSLPDPTCLLDLDCRILMVNDGAMKLFGSQEEDFFIGRSVLDFILPQDHPHVLDNIKQCLETHLANQSKYSILTESGTLPIKTTSFILNDQSKKPVALMSLVKDASKDTVKSHSCAEPEPRAQLYLDLLRHDISNKLQVIMSSAELLQDPLDESIRSKMIQNIIDSILSCKSIILRTEILENYEKQPMGPQFLDRLLKSALYDLVKCPSDIDLAANIQVADARILCDEYITHLIDNLFQNAWEHNTKDEKRIWITLKEDGDGYLLSIEDNGPGIATETRNNGTSLKGRSTGIGLYICHALIEKYNGWMKITDRIQNQPEQGTRVLIWFPKYFL